MRAAGWMLVGLVAVTVLSLGATGCSSCRKAQSGKPKVAVSIFPIYDLTRRVAGPDAEVSLLLPPGHNEHHFDPTPKEIEEVAASSLAVMVGLGLDPWMEKLVKDAAPKARVLKVGDRVPTRTVQEDVVGDEAADKAAEAAGHGHDEHGHEEHAEHGHDEHEHEKGAVDPHVWLDPSRTRLIVKAIGEEMARADAAHAVAYRQRAEELDKVLEALDKEVEQHATAWKTREIITFHGSFGYFADRYKLKIVAVIEPFPGSTPTGQYIEDVLKVVSKRKVPVLFSEPQLDARPAKTLADAAKVPLGVLDPVGGGPETDSYEKMIRFDVASFDKYLK